MSGQDSKSKKDNSAVRTGTVTDVSSKSKEDSAHQLTKEEKIVAASPADVTTTTGDKTSDQSTKTMVIIDLPPSSDASSSIERDPQSIVQPQLYGMDRSLDEAKERVLKPVEEARREIPRYTERIRSCQEESIQFAQEIAENYIKAQRDIINSMHSSLLPYWESVYALFWNGWWFSPSRMIEAYATMVSSFVGNTLRAPQLVNNNMLANMDAFKRTIEQTKESGNDLARACVNLAKKIERLNENEDNNIVAQDRIAENGTSVETS
jgi:hypothetical protein